MPPSCGASSKFSSALTTASFRKAHNENLPDAPFSAGSGRLRRRDGCRWPLESHRNPDAVRCPVLVSGLRGGYCPSRQKRTAARLRLVNGKVAENSAGAAI